MPINNSKTINAWCSYDIANSAYNLSINTVLYPIYYDEMTRNVFGSEIVQFFGISIRNTVLYEYAIALGYLLIIFLTVAFSGIADLGGYRKRFMQVFTAIGAFSCMGLSLFTGENVSLGIALPILAVMGYAGSLVYYNSFLPIIASPDRQDRISARGFSYGYAGSMLLLIFNIFTIENYESFGFSEKLDAIKFSFILVGVWWLSISQFAFYFLKEKKQKVSINRTVFTKGFSEILQVFKYINKHKNMRRFLLSFFFFSMGVQTIMIVATLFGKIELGITTSKLIMTIIIIQVVAIVGAILFGRVSTRYGNKTSLVWMLCIWIVVCIAAYFVVSEFHFYIIAALVGLVMGGIQSQARSTWSKLIPTGNNDTASFFSFYDSTEKLAITFGMLGFGILEHVTGSMRDSTLLLSGFFIVSLIIIAFTSFSNKGKE